MYLSNPPQRLLNHARPWPIELSPLAVTGIGLKPLNCASMASNLVLRRGSSGLNGTRPNPFYWGRARSW